MDSEIDDINLFTEGYMLISFNLFEIMPLSHYFSYKSVCKLINILILCKKYSMGLTGRSKVLYDIL